ncbi:MAG: hypothetical protein VKS61_06355 [Candidatus Sericytochromatia bacterium]|nr:hypothetical protein [Candidatus Sericytochromatia bacterium]
MSTQRLPYKVAAAGLLAWGCAELLMRVTLASNPGYRLDPVRGLAYRAGTLVQGTEGYCVTHINADGYRGPDASPPLAGEVRVLAVGDSYTEAFQVRDEETYVGLLQHHLARHTQRPVRVINGGASGGNPPEYVQLAGHFQQRFQPTWTVLQLTDSDFTEPELTASEHRFRLVATPAGFETASNAGTRARHDLLQRFPLLGVFTGFATGRVAITHLKRLQEAPAPTTAAAPSAVAAPQPLVTRALPWLARELARRYPRAVVLYLPTLAAHPGRQAETQLERLATGHLRGAGIPVINMRADFEDFEAYSRQRVQGFDNTEPGVGHLNAYGHALVARRLVQFLTPRVSP